MKHLKLIIYSTWALILIGCAGAPSQELADARSAMIAAEEAHGKETAGEHLTAAKKYLNNAEVQLELGNYTDARRQAVHARNEAKKARNIAIAVEEARHAVARASQAQSLNLALQEAFDETIRAAKKGDERAVAAMSRRTVEMAANNENRAYLEKAKLKLKSCGAPAGLMHKNPEIWRQAQIALSRDEGALALQHASTLCNL